MKKTYIAPNAIVVKMKYVTLLFSASDTQALQGTDGMAREAEFDDEEY